MKHSSTSLVNLSNLLDLILLLLLLLHLQSSSCDYYDLNVDCGLHVDIVATDALTFRYVPFYVKLYRCQGKDLDDTEVDLCHATQIENVVYMVEDLEGDGTGGLTPINMKNHTKCEYSCRRNDSMCKEGETWNGNLCSCCPQLGRHCNENTRWDEDYCSCMPNVIIDESGAPQRAPKTMAVKIVLIIMVAESIVLTSASYFIYKCFCKKNKGGDGEVVVKAMTSTHHQDEESIQNGSAVTHNRDSFTYTVDKDQKRYVVPAASSHGNYQNQSSITSTPPPYTEIQAESSFGNFKPAPPSDQRSLINKYT